MAKRYIIALDEGTTSARTLVFDTVKQKIIAVKNRRFQQIFPDYGWVEHDPEEIFGAQLDSFLEAISSIKGFRFSDVHGIGVTNQRETVVAWDKRTLAPVCNAVVWQCRRTAGIVEELVVPNKELIYKKTGLLPDAYFSATKMKWILDNVKGARELAEEGNLALGTIDAWLIAKLTEGETFATDASNASRTMLFNIHTMQWDDELLALFGIPKSVLPEVVPSSGVIGQAKILEHEIPIAGIAGDQQSALFGQCCHSAGMAKNTYGTGCFILMNTGSVPIGSKNGLLTTVAWNMNGKTTYALEGSVFNAGSSIQWLKDKLGLVSGFEECEELAKSVPDTDGVYLVPAFTGMGAPYWDMNARGIITGLTRGTTKAHIVRATLESMAYSTKEIVDAMEDDSGIKTKVLRVDGGASNNGFLMQFQADVLGIKLSRPISSEATAMGVVFFAGLATGAFRSMEELSVDKNGAPKTFERVLPEEDVKKRFDGWKKAVAKALES